MERLFAQEVAGQASEKQKPTQLCKKTFSFEIYLDRLDCSDSLKEAWEAMAKINKLK